jgi:hypothetical protein
MPTVRASASEIGFRPTRWAVLLSLLLAQLFTTPAGFVVLDRSEPVISLDLDDFAGQFHRLRFVRDPKTLAPADSFGPEASALECLPRMETAMSAVPPPSSVRCRRLEHQSTLTRRSRAPGASQPIDGIRLS